MHYYALLLAAACGSSLAKMSPTEEYPNQATLVDDKFFLFWRFTDSDITFEIHAETTGWVGIGFSPNGGMDKSDIIVGWVKNGKAKITDRFGSNGNGFPPKDSKQNVDVIDGRECDGWTMIKFTRPLAACEDEYDRTITTDTQKLIWAYGTVDPARRDIRPKANEYYHGDRRGVKFLYLLANQDNEDPADHEKHKHFDVLAGNYTLPPQDTYYHCKIFKVPKLTTKHHIIKYEPVIEEKNKRNVHHILIYHCSDMVAQFHNGRDSSACYDFTNTDFLFCGTTFVGWAVGGVGYSMPKEAGFSIGSTGDPKYIRMEIHYDNPEKRNDIVDNSGIRFTYTSELREHDAGVFAIGMTLDIYFVPPHAESFKTVGFCRGDCLKERMEDFGVSNITTIAVLMHSHLAGRAMRLRHIRNGTELRYIGNDRSYHFDYQQTKSIDPPIQLLPNDDLQMECVYDTKFRDKLTMGGFSTREEMCVGFVLYYPKINLGYCTTAPNYAETYKYFGIEKFKGNFYLKNTVIESPEYMKGKSAYQVISEHKWNETEADRFSAQLQKFPQLQQCTPMIRSKSKRGYVTAPTISKLYEEPNAKCLRSPNSMSQSVKAGYCRKRKNMD